MEVIPISWSDQPNPIPNLRTRTFFITDHPLDEKALKNGLDQLIRNHWRKLGARLVPSHESHRLEYHLPHIFPDDYELFKWSAATAGHSMHEVYELSKIVHTGDDIVLLPSVDRIDKLVRPADWPFERKDEPPNSPLLYIHLTVFNDAAVLAMSWPHVLADQGGVANIVKAWLAVVEGKPPPEMVGYNEDVLGNERLSSYQVKKGNRIGRMRVRSKKEQALVFGRIGIDMVKEIKEESHIVFLPIEVVHNLRDRARKSLEGKHELANQISNGDIVTAIFTKFARINVKSEYNISLSQTINCRIPELADEKGKGFVHNSVHYATANFPLNPSTPLHEIALQNRKAINKAVQQSDIVAGVSTLREIAKCGQIMLICEPHHRLYSASNWSASWQGIDFSKATPKSYKMTMNEKQPIVIGQSRTQRNPMRNRAVTMCRTKDGFWCDFAAPLKAMAMIKELLIKDPLLESL